MKKRVILAYSGGLDTSVILRWLTEQGYEVIAFAADVGQEEDFEALREKALASGASEVVISDLKEDFVRNFVFPCVQFNAVYEGRYLLGTYMARPCIAREMVRVARLKGAESIAHGATGKGNDQVRFELTVYTLCPEIEIIAPWRDPEFRDLIPGRREAIEYAEKYGIPVKATTDKPWSSDDNLYHISYEAGILEDPSARPPEDMFEKTVSPSAAPDRETLVRIGFDKGVPVSIDGEQMSPVALLEYLNKVAGENGVGRIDIVESRFIGMKSRGVYETPGGTVLLTAHRDLEGLTLDNATIQLKDTLAPTFAKRVYDGFWFAPDMVALRALLDETQKYVTGEVTVSLYRGNCIAMGRHGLASLYDEKIASMEADQGAFDQSDSSGFIRIVSLPLRRHYYRRKRCGEVSE